MTCCLGIVTRQGLVMASDSRTNAGFDQVNVCRKMHTFVTPGERVFVVLTSGSLSLTQSVITLLRRDFDQGRGLAAAPSLYDAARVWENRSAASPTWTAPPSRRTSFASTSTFCWADRSAASRRICIYLSARQPARRHGGFAVPADRRVQVWPAHPRPRRALRRDVAGGGREVRPDLDGLHHALERHGRAAHRPARLPRRRAAHHAPPTLPRQGSRPARDPS